jgi:hypothetical protein
MEPKKIKTLSPVHNAGFLRMERQTPFVEKRGDHRVRLLNGRHAFGHHNDVIGIPGHPVPFPQPFGQSIEGDVGQQWAHHAALGSTFRRGVQRALFPIASFQPLFDQLSPWHQAKAVQDKVLADMVKGPLDIGVQDVVVVADGTVVECHVDLLDGILAAASGAKAVALRFELRFKPRFQGVFNHHLHHPITQRRDAQRPLFAIGLGDIDAPDRGGSPGLRLTQVVDQLGTLLGRGQPFPVDPWRLPPTVDLGDPPHRH